MGRGKRRIFLNRRLGQVQRRRPVVPRSCFVRFRVQAKGFERRGADTFNLPAGSNYLTVTRPDSNTWTSEATAADMAQLESAPMSGKNVKVNEGYYRMPFKVVVTR